jgi:hypothetical protein
MFPAFPPILLASHISALLASLSRATPHALCQSSNSLPTTHIILLNYGDQARLEERAPPLNSPKKFDNHRSM